MPTLSVISGPAAGTSLEIQREVTIGRESADLDIPDVEMSRRHAALRVVPDGVEVEDLGSLNGTYVNGERIAGRVTLAASGTVRLGTSEIAIQVATQPPAPAGGPDVTKARDVVPAEPDVTKARDVVAGAPDVTKARPTTGGPDVTAPRPTAPTPDEQGPGASAPPPAQGATTVRGVPGAAEAPGPDGDRSRWGVPVVAAALIAVAAVVVIVLLLA